MATMPMEGVVVEQAPAVVSSPPAPVPMDTSTASDTTPSSSSGGPSVSGGNNGGAASVVASTVSTADTGPSLLDEMTPVLGVPEKIEEEKRAPKWQLDLLMEKLRQKSMQLKSLNDTSKNIRQALTERRCIIDKGEKANLQKSLDRLQQSIHVNSLQSMVERLEMVARQLGLKFTPGATGHEWFISSDMFYLELVIDPNGAVEDVKIQHDGKTEQESCPEIVESLKNTDFVDFTAHLEGLVSIYQLNADKKIKSKAYIALQAMESDLSSIATTYSHIQDAETVIMKSLLGILQPRRGGHPVKLVYFISPYEFLDISTKSTLNNDIKTVLSKKLGCVATINIQASTLHKLQMSTTVNLTRTQDGKSVPRYGVLNATNSTALPACFVLSLGRSIPICKNLLKAIQATTEIDAFDMNNMEPILSLISHQISNGTVDCLDDKGLFVSLPDQVHCYFMTETANLEGIMVSSIQFTQASQLPQIFAILRQQLAFNTLVGSCIRVGSKPELDHIVFEVNALSHQKLSVCFQHPLDDSLVTLELDLRDVTHPHCHLHAIANATDIIPTLEEHACKVAKRSMSIPIILRAVIRRWQSMKVKFEPPNPDFSVPVGGGGNNNMNNMDVSRISDRSCGAESGERRSNANHHGSIVPPGILNFSNNPTSSNNSSKLPMMPTSSYSISPVGYQPPQNPMDLLSSYMSPFLGLPNQMNIPGGTSFPSITSNMAIQMLASQIGQNSAVAGHSQMLMGLLDQVGQQTQKRRKRKNTSDNNLQSPSPKSSPQANRPSQSPSRQLQKSPIRRQSDSSDGSGVDKNAINMMNIMNELGMDHQLPDSRWNIDITPVTTGSETIDDVETLKKQGNKKPAPKRSMSLDSHSSEDIASIQSLLDGDFKPLMTPSLSITPVSTNSNVNSLLASIRPGIEIIPLPNHSNMSIPTSLTVTPIIPGKSSNSNNSNVEKQLDNIKMKKTKDRNNAPSKRKMIMDDGDLKPSKLPFIDNKGRISPSFGSQKKSSSSPNIMSQNNSPSKPIASQGKPSVSTLKSVSSSNSNSPKFGDSNNGTSATTTNIKPKVKKLNSKAVKNFMGIGNIPPLKSLSPDLVSKMEVSSKADVFKMGENMKGMNQAQLAHSAVTAALQQAAASLILNSNAAQKPIPAAKKGLAAVIDKLKSVHSSSESLPGFSEPRKELSATTMSANDYLKVSSAITNDVLQQKKALTANSAGVGGQGSGIPGQESSSSYMVKGGQGLKLTINKAKLKDPSKSPKVGGLGMKSPLSGFKKIVPGMKPLSALSAKLASVTKKSVTPTKELNKLGNVLKAKDVKSPKLESEELTKKLFLPGSVKSLESGIFSTAPIFNPNKFQIPKKIKNAGPTLGSPFVSGENNKKSNSNSSENIVSSSSSSRPSTSTNEGSSKDNNKITSNSIRALTPTMGFDNNNAIPMIIPTTTPTTTDTTPDSTYSYQGARMMESISLMDMKALGYNKLAGITAAAAAAATLGPDSTTTTANPLPDVQHLYSSASGGDDNSDASRMNQLDDFASPESPDPDPINCGVNTSTPQTIPTTPLNQAIISEDSPKLTPPPPTISATNNNAPLSLTSSSGMPLLPRAVQQETPEEVDEDQLFIDDGTNENGNKMENSSSVGPVEEPTSATSNGNENTTTTNTTIEQIKSPQVEMPPPPPPDNISVASVSVTSPAPVLLPPASPKPVASPLSSGPTTTVSIASVHIVHSPQPNSPALLRSPLVQASPAASPYAIDDDLMDEALIGGSSK